MSGFWRPGRAALRGCRRCCQCWCRAALVALLLHRCSCWHRVFLEVSISVAATHVVTANAQIGGAASRNGCPPPAGGQCRPAGRDSVERPPDTTPRVLSNRLGHSRFGTSDGYARIGVIVPPAALHELVVQDSVWAYPARCGRLAAQRQLGV